jgi:predicted solute-binding protein
VGLYVNELTLDPGEKGRQAVREFYTRAAAAGLLPGIEPRWASDSARD